MVKNIYVVHILNVGPRRTRGKKRTKKVIIKKQYERLVKIERSSLGGLYKYDNIFSTITEIVVVACCFKNMKCLRFDKSTGLYTSDEIKRGS